MIQFNYFKIKSKLKFPLPKFNGNKVIALCNNNAKRLFNHDNPFNV